jgi:hypothetical protein
MFVVVNITAKELDICLQLVLLGLSVYNYIAIQQRLEIQLSARTDQVAIRIVMPTNMLLPSSYPCRVN